MKRVFFSSFDYTFCDFESCTRKEDCMRYLHHKEYNRFKNQPRISILMVQNSENCKYFKDNRLKEE